MVKKIKALCKQRKTTLRQMQSDLGFGAASITRWDRNSPSIDKVKMVADYLKCTVDELLKE